VVRVLKSGGYNITHLSSARHTGLLQVGVWEFQGRRKLDNTDLATMKLTAQYINKDSLSLVMYVCTLNRRKRQNRVYSENDSMYLGASSQLIPHLGVCRCRRDATSFATTMASSATYKLLTPSARTTPRILAQFIPKGAGRSLSQALRYSTATSPPSTPPTADSKPEFVLPEAKGRDGATDWSRSYSGLSTQPFSAEISEVLQAPIDAMDVEMKPGEQGHF
jgi:hypothetical protein